MKMKIKLGDKVKHKITNYEGIVTAYCRHLNGCDRLGVKTAELFEGKPIDSQWFDVLDLDLVVERITEETPPGQGIG
jgi:hypothetical protein